MPRERSFKDYVADRFYNELYDGIREFIKDNPRDLDLKLYRVQDIDDIELSDVRVVFVDVHDQPGTGISFDIAVDADIETIEEDKYCNEDEEASQWFMVRCSGDLACSLDDFEIHSISVYSGKIPQPKPMSDALVPIIRKDDLEKVATDFLKRNYPKALLQPMAVDPKDLAESMGLKVELKHIAKDCSDFGQIFFQDAEAEFYDKKRDPSINSLVLILLGMHLPPEISFRLIELSPVSLNFAKNDHIWYNFALQHLSKLSMEKIEAFFSEHNVQI